MRQIVLDTETTGLDPKQGHRIIEVAGLELLNRRPTGRHFHEYIQPDREIDAGAQAVHGITAEFLADKPRFAEIAPALLSFIEGAELIIHNAPFDTGFLDAEFARLEALGQLKVNNVSPKITDTLVMARALYPGKRNNLDALCERYEIDNTQRTLHGALLDAELLAEVYLSMTRGQDSLISDDDVFLPRAGSELENRAPRKPLRVQMATEAELAEHQESLAAVQKASKGNCVWEKIENPPSEEIPPENKANP